MPKIALNKLLIILLLIPMVSFAGDKSNWTPRIFYCENIMFEFTLGYYSNPTDKELNEICSCMNNKIAIEAKEINFKVKKGKAKFTEKDMILLQKEFGGAIQSCASKFIEKWKN